MELRHLRYFIALSDCLNFTHAAERVHVTQSTLSHQIKQLEEELNQQLFIRKDKKVFLTESGETFLIYARKALYDIDQGILMLSSDIDDTDTIYGEIRIGATQSFCSGLIPACLTNLFSKYSTVKAVVKELSAHVIIEDLRSEYLDIGIAYRPDNLDDLWFEPLYNEEMVLIVSNKHPYAKRKRIRMIELQSQQLTLLTKEFATRKILDDCFKEAGINPTIIAETNTFSPILGLVQSTNICSIISEIAISHIHTKGLNVISIENPTPIRTPGLLWKKNEKKSAFVKSFASIIRRTIVDAKLKKP